MIHIQGHQAMVGFQIFSESGDFFFSDTGHAAHIHIIRQVVNLNGNGYGIGGASFDVFFIIFLIGGLCDTPHGFNDFGRESFLSRSSNVHSVSSTTSCRIPTILSFRFRPIFITRMG